MDGEFLIGFALTSTGNVREKLKYVFRTYDQDKDGFINYEDLKNNIPYSKIMKKYCILTKNAFPKSNGE